MNSLSNPKVSSKRKDLTGQEFHFLKVLAPADDLVYRTSNGKIVRHKQWLCECTGHGPGCTGTKIVKERYLLDGTAKSCGCMSPKHFRDLTGQKFGKLKVLKRVEGPDPKRVYWECRCDCENHTIVVVEAYRLTSGNTLSCGCYNKEKNITHGQTKTRLYTVWESMKKRCDNPNNSGYHNYGGRGIKVCDEWYDFETFSNWAYANGYDPDAAYGACTIDRINHDGDYCPENCRFASMEVQDLNKRNTRYEEYNGEKVTIVELSKRTGISESTLRARLKRGMTVEEAVTTPVSTDYTITYNGVSKHISYFSKEYGIPVSVLKYRIFKKGWAVEDALNTPYVEPERYGDQEYMGALGSYRDYERALNFKKGMIGRRIREGLTLDEAISMPVRSNRTTPSAVFFIEPKTRKPISQFSDLIDTPQYQEDLKTFGELISGKLA